MVGAVTGSAYLLVASTIAFAEQRNPSPTISPNHHSSVMTDADARARQDNTAVNKRDRNEEHLTPIEQSNDKRALEITQKIRQAVVKRDDLSTYAHNIKIITTETGVVTLRGPVRSAKERDVITSIANEVVGANRVNRQLEIVPEKKD